MINSEQKRICNFQCETCPLESKDFIACVNDCYTYRVELLD